MAFMSDLHFFQFEGADRYSKRFKKGDFIVIVSCWVTGIKQATMITINTDSAIFFSSFRVIKKIVPKI